MKQLSAFPEERPDEELKEKKPTFKGLRRRYEAYLRKNGPYAFCKAVETLSANKAECEKFKVTPKEAYTVGNEVFSESVAFTETIKTFLKKVKEVPGFQLPKFEFK